MRAKRYQYLMIYLPFLSAPHNLTTFHIAGCRLKHLLQGKLADLIKHL